MQKETQEVINLIQAMSKGLQILPEQFDTEFSRKLNRVLDAAQEVDKQTDALSRMLRVEIPELLKAHTEEVKKQVQINMPQPVQVNYWKSLLVACLAGFWEAFQLL